MFDLADLQSKVELVLAREAIRELRARYSIYATRGDWRQIANLFSEDGVFDSLRPNGERMLWSGRELIFTNLQERNVPVIPLISNEIITVNGASAVGSCTMMTSISPDPKSNGFVGQYYDEMRCEEGHWLFTLRRFDVVAGSF